MNRKNLNVKLNFCGMVLTMGRKQELLPHV